ncbi:MAG: bifunctional phosphoserine phosphatase/homoserine phosphotransferase ThrH [Bacteroidales bacterium]|nr:bifunctional phosphoserine phosphatase/homoserine phosphotransferase ThrH [Bacteroidales bacterium]MBK9357348.1 bifunctional phosphoserine phosphatase/homoserine phosphotransferase ThrH [Bacteroidales bacterium]
MYVICTDLEGVFVPEVWINVAARTGIAELKLTTRDISDYNVLMKQRIRILAEHGLKLKDIQDVIATIRPLEGALEFLQWLRDVTQVIVVSDTFAQFAKPLMMQLDKPTIFCHNLVVDENDNITGYTLRQSDPKRKVVQALQSLDYKVIAFGDSYNDVTMLQQAEVGILFCPPQKVIDDYPELPVVYDYTALKKLIEKHIFSE